MSTSLPPELPPEFSPRPQGSTTSKRKPSKATRSPGLTIPGMIIICLGPTAFVMLLSTWISSGIGGLPNVVFAIVSIYAAVKIQRRNLLAAVVSPPLIYSAAILLASGPINGKSGGVVLNSFATLGTFLAVGAPWLFFTTIVCFIVIVVRGRTGR